MINFEKVYLYIRSDYGGEPGPIIGTLISSDTWLDEAYFIPSHIENMKDIDMGYTVSGKEGYAHNGNVWFRHKVVNEEVEQAFLTELEIEYRGHEQEVEYYKRLFLKHGGTEEELDAE